MTCCPRLWQPETPVPADHPQLRSAQMRRPQGGRSSSETDIADGIIIAMANNMHVSVPERALKPKHRPTPSRRPVLVPSNLQREQRPKGILLRPVDFDVCTVTSFRRPDRLSPLSHAVLSQRGGGWGSFSHCASPVPSSTPTLRLSATHPHPHQPPAPPSRSLSSPNHKPPATNIKYPNDLPRSKGQATQGPHP